MRVAIRTDASTLIGSGHVMRCLALADCLIERAAEILFICREHEGHLCRMIATRGIAVSRLRNPSRPAASSGYAAWLGVSQVEDAEETLKVLGSDRTWDWLIVDHYALDETWERMLRPRVNKILVIDDLANRSHVGDVVLDQCGVAANESRYQAWVPADCKRFEGPRYALLRQEFSAYRSRPPVRDKLKRLLIFFGGSDLDNVTKKALEALRFSDVEGITVDVVVGASNPHSKALEALCREASGLHVHRQVSNMAKLMKRADLAIGAGGVTLWERCALGLPSIVLSCADNQESSCEYAAAHGAILYLGRAEAVSADRIGQAIAVLNTAGSLRQHMSRAGQQLVDARGAQRIVRFMSAHATAIVLRSASVADRDKILEWRNDPSTRKYATNPDRIDPSDHAAWFTRILADPDFALLIAEQNEEPIGVLRYDRCGHAAVVSLYLKPDCAGQGFGQAILAVGQAWLQSHWPEVTRLQAHIKLTNEASLRTFAAAGFIQDAGIYFLDLARPAC